VNGMQAKRAAVLVVEDNRECFGRSAGACKRVGITPKV